MWRSTFEERIMTGVKNLPDSFETKTLNPALAGIMNALDRANEKESASEKMNLLFALKDKNEEDLSKIVASEKKIASVLRVQSFLGGALMILGCAAAPPLAFALIAIGVHWPAWSLLGLQLGLPS